jgi:hypothetical protein
MFCRAVFPQLLSLKSRLWGPKIFGLAKYELGSQGYHKAFIEKKGSIVIVIVYSQKTRGSRYEGEKALRAHQESGVRGDMLP